MKTNPRSSPDGDATTATIELIEPSGAPFRPAVSRAARRRANVIARECLARGTFYRTDGNSGNQDSIAQDAHPELAAEFNRRLMDGTLLPAARADATEMTGDEASEFKRAGLAGNHAKAHEIYRAATMRAWRERRGLLRHRVDRSPVGRAPSGHRPAGRTASHRASAIARDDGSSDPDPGDPDPDAHPSAARRGDLRHAGEILGDVLEGLIGGAA